MVLSKNSLGRPPQRTKVTSKIKDVDVPTPPSLNTKYKKEDLEDSFRQLPLKAEYYGPFRMGSLDDLKHIPNNGSESQSDAESSNGSDNLYTPKNNHYRGTKSECDSDLDEDSSSDSLSDIDDSDLVAKGIDQRTKSYQQNRSLPYQGVTEFKNHLQNHCSGGTLLVDQYSAFSPYFNNIQAPSQNVNPVAENNEEVYLKNLVEKINEKFSADELERINSIIKSIVDCNLNEGSETELKDVEVASNNATSIVCEKESNVGRNVLDEDSAYETSSPHSSISNSPMPNTYCSSEGSPSHDSQSSYNIILPESYELKPPNICQEIFKIPSPISIELPEKSQPLNIPVSRASFRLPTTPHNTPANNKCLPIAPNGLPSFQHCQLPNLAPESVLVVHEEKMNIPAEIRIKKEINSNQFGIQWIKILLDRDFFVVSPDEETKLMKHLRSQNSPKFFYQILVAHLERSKQEDREKGLSYLKFTNQKNENALSIALFECTDKPMVARYILETLRHLGDNIDQADFEGNSLLHRLVQQGDKFAHIIAELLNMKCFDVNRKNHLLQTPLHLATQLHKRPSRNQNFSALVVCKLLIKHKAVVLTKDSNGMTPIHTLVKHSCDPQMLKALLSHEDIILHRRSVEVEDHLGNTALHEAAKRHDLPFEIQARVMKQLKDSSWSMTTRNLNEMTPLSLLPEDIKPRIMEYINMK